MVDWLLNRGIGIQTEDKSKDLILQPFTEGNRGAKSCDTSQEIDIFSSIDSRFPVFSNSISRQSSI